jgi:hypothetical protein
LVKNRAVSSSDDYRGLTAPVGSVDLAACDEHGEPYIIWPCTDCLPWHAEVHVDWAGVPFVREWHAVECPQFQTMTKHPNRNL